MTTFRRLITPLSWLVPLVALSVCSLFFFTGASREPKRSVADWLIENQVISAAEAQAALLTLPGGWRVPLTSISRPVLPAVLPPNVSAAGNTGRPIIFPHFGDGAMGGGLAMSTTLFLANDLATAVNAQIRFFGNDGSPLSLSLDGTAGSTFAVALNPREMKRLKTSGSGAVKSGWIRIDADQPLSATISFGISQSNGSLVTDLGIAESIPGTHFTLFADTIGAANTGIGVVNPSESQALTLHLELRRANGALVGSTDINLPPRAHMASFLNEIFQGVVGIGEFEGSMVITSAQPFAGVTLRTLADQLTSVPLVSPAPADSTRTNLALSHVGNGSAGGIQLRTTVLLINNTDQATTGTVDFLLSDGNPMSVKIGNTTASSFPFNLPPRAVSRLVTSGEGTLVAGWARVSMDQPISGSGIFHMYNAAGSVISEAGVEAAPLKTKSRLVADTMGNANTGIALVNPNADGEGDIMSATVRLFRKTGEQVSSKSIDLEPLKHTAQFLTEIFSNVPNIGEFEGVVWIETDLPAAQMSLRQVGATTTSMPVWARKYGFAPHSVLTVAQNVAGQPPALEWLVHQNSEDYSIETITLSCPDFGFSPNNFERGEEIGQGYVPAETNTGAYSLVATKNGAGEFDVIDISSGASRFATGKILGSASSGFQIQLTMLQALASTYSWSASDLRFFIHAGLINPPSSARTVTVTSDFTSVSGNKNYEARYARQTTHPLSFVAPDVTRATAIRLGSLFLSPRATGTIFGSNLGATPQVICPVAGGGTAAADIIEVAADRVDFFVPPDIARGVIRVDNGTGPGNALTCPVIFAPSMDVQPASKIGGADTTFTFTFNQGLEEYALSTFALTLHGVTANLAGLAAGTKVGGGTVEGPDSASFDIKVDTAGTATVNLGLYQSGATNPTATVILSKVTGGVRFVYSPVEAPTLPEIYSEANELELNFTGIPIRLPAATNRVSAVALLQSGPTGPGGAQSAAQVLARQTFKTE